MSNSAAPELTPEQIRAIIANRKRSYREVSTCMRLDLAQEYERLDEELRTLLAAKKAGLKGSESLGGSEDPAADPVVAGLVERMDAVRDEMLGATIKFRVEPVGDAKWNRRVLEHPPRRQEDGTAVVSDARLGIDVDAFFRALIPESVVWPKLDAREWADLLSGENALTNGQVSAFATAIWALNQEDTNVPFSRTASTIGRRSQPEPQQPGPGE